MERRKASCFWSSTGLRNLQQLSMKSWMRLTLKPNARLFWAWSSASKSTRTKSSLCSASIRSRRFVAAKIRTTQTKEEKVCNIVGGVISPVIANMTLDGLEAAVDASVGPTERARRKFKVNVNRYADDFVVTGVSKEILEQNVLPAVKQFLTVRGLELSEEKTRITHIADGFDFLGQNVRKYGGKLLIKPANKSVKALMEKVREIVRRHRSATQTNLILQLNPVIRGWAMYHRHVVSKAHFTSIDAHIWQLLWKWALRRHPTKGTGWVKHKYFHVEGHRTWAFTARTKDRGVTRLFRAAMVPIVRHVQICGQANPFDPAWSPYFARRRTATDG
jgi:RNA-directed DNA polymerase